MKRVIMLLSASGFVLTLALASWAQVKVLPTDTATIDGTVETIDYPKRVVSLKTTTGELVTLDVPEAAKRFNEVKVGDRVLATYNTNVTVRLKPPGEPPVDMTRTATTGGGEVRPGGTAAIERTLTVTVSAIDKNVSTMTFVGPNERKYTRHVSDPQVFEQVKVGDRVDITMNTDLTVAVVLAEAAMVVDPKLVGTWVTHDGPCGATCTLTIAPSGTASFAIAGSGVQVVFAQFTPAPGLDLTFPLGGKAELALSTTERLVGIYTPPQARTGGQSHRFVPIAFMRQTVDEATGLDAAAQDTLTKFKAETKGAEAVIANAKGVLVCPKITKGGFIIGVEGGSCVLYSGASQPLYYSTTAVKAGFLAGVQSYAMILALNTDTALAKFTSGARQWEVGADTSVVIAKTGAGGSLDTTNLKRDVVAFIFGEKGLMADLSLEGSRFKQQDLK
jgi:lipid-binding SYLF domain-containing protein